MRNNFLVSSESPRRNPYLISVDNVIHGKLRDSRKTTWFTENYVIHRAPVETTQESYFLCEKLRDSQKTT
jgi:hypothetical protein